MSTSNENLIISNEKNDTKKKLIPLLFYFKNNTTSQDPSFPLNNLLNKESKIGWISNRFCTYPQEIIIEFHSFVNIKQINILINETKIPTVIEFVNCIYIPINNTNDGQLSSKRNNKYECQYRNIGFIKLSSNVESNYRARELRKIYVNLLTRKIKLIVHRNYYNSVNTFCQVGIVNLNFYGYILDDDNNKYKYIEKNNEYRKETNLKLNYADLCMDEDIEGIDDAFFTQKMDKKCNERMKELNEEMEKKKECEEYDDCKIIKKEIDQLKKITYKIYNLELYKNDCVKRNDFDNAKKIKRDINIFKKMLNDYLNKTCENENQKEIENEENNNINKNEENINNITINENNNKINNAKKINNRLKLRISRTQQDIFNSSEHNFDNVILPTLQRKINTNNLNNISNVNNSTSFDNNNSMITSGRLDSFIGLNENEQIEKQPLEELAPEIKTKYQILINVLGEETIKKIFSKYIYHKEKGFEELNSKAKDIIIDSQKTTQETNKYIVSLINICFLYIDDRHPSIVSKCLELFLKVLKSIKERSSSNKTEYDFKITKRILNKIKEKLSHISKIVRTKASELYCFMLETDFCEYNSLILELVEKDVNEYYEKLGVINNNNNLNFKLNASKGLIGIGSSVNLKPDLSKQLIITKMGIFFEIFKKFEKDKENEKFDIKKFPQNIVGDFIIININHPKEEVRDITKEVLIKYIHIFGNQIFNKLKMFIDNRELSKLIQDKIELQKQLILFKEEQKNKNVSKTKLVEINTMNYYQNYLNKTKHKTQRLNPIPEYNNNSNINNNQLNNIKLNNNSNKNNNKTLIKSASQPKYRVSNKIKLKPIKKSLLNNTNVSENKIVIDNKKDNNNIIQNNIDNKEESKN